MNQIGSGKSSTRVIHFLVHSEENASICEMTKVPECGEKRFMSWRKKHHLVLSKPGDVMVLVISVVLFGIISFFK